MSKKFGFESSLYPSKTDEISLELNKLKFFKMEYPRGGQYNDGYRLEAKFKHLYDDDLIRLLMELGIRSTLLEVKPHDEKSYGEIKVGGTSKWLQHFNIYKINGERCDITYGPTRLRIVANPGSYEIELEDVIRAKNIEKSMNNDFFNPRLIFPD